MRKGMTKGKCYLCGGSFSKGAMSRHLQACRRANPQPLPGRGKERTARLFHLVVQGHGLPEYWLHLEAPANGTLAELDDFLRSIWLECCGHLSAFTLGERSYSVAPQGSWERGMGVALEKVLGLGAQFHHEYDFGTTTELSLRVVVEREGAVRGRAIQLLARNDPPPIPCGECGREAAQVCSICLWEGAGWLCDACALQHECGGEMMLPVVNSPRVGMCGYTG